MKSYMATYLYKSIPENPFLIYSLMICSKSKCVMFIILNPLMPGKGNMSLLEAT